MKDKHRSLKGQVLLSLVLLAVISSAICSASELEVPYYTQDGSGWCWATSLSMVLKYYGFEKKPWEIAADFNRPIEDGVYGWEVSNIETYLEDHYNSGYSDAWELQTFWLESSLKNKVFEVISGGHPVWMAISNWNWEKLQYSPHAIVFTGCTGTDDTDDIIIHDPSGALTGSENDVVYSSMSWNTFFSKIETNPVYGNKILYAKPNKLTPDTNPKPLSIQVEPDYLIFGLEGSHSSDKCLLLKWDGEEPYDGYRYEPGSEDIDWPLDDDGDAYEYDYKATQTSTLDVKPTYSNSSLVSNNVIFRYKYSIYNVADSSLVRNWLSPLSPVVTEPISGNLADEYNYVLPMCELPEGVYKLEVAITDENGSQVYDKCSFVFGVVWEGAPVEVRPSQGPNGSISPNTNFMVLPCEKVTFTATPNNYYQVDEWIINGSVYDNSGATSISPHIMEDTTVLVTFKPDGTVPSQILVAGSTSPDVFEISIAPDNGKGLNIPVYNPGFSSTTVNCSKSGTASNWTSLESTSFTLGAQELKQYHVTINVPDTASSGTYQVNISFNGIVQPISIRVAATGDVFSEFLQPSTGYINGNNSTENYPFINSSYEYFEISGKYHTFAQSYLTLSESEYINVDSYNFRIQVYNMGASSNQDLIILMNQHVIGTINSSMVPIGSAEAYYFNGRSWDTLEEGVNVVTFKLETWNSSDETKLWRIYDNMFISTLSTTSAWTASSAVDIPYNIWNSIQDGYMDSARVYGNVTGCSDSGVVYLFNNGDNVAGTTINTSDVGDRRSWSLLKSELEETNLFVLKGDTSTTPVVSLSNLELEITFNNNDPVLEMTKTLSSNKLTVGQQATVTVRIENTRDGSTTGYDTDLSDSLPAGLTLAAGVLNKNDIGKIDYQDVETNTYTIRADQPGQYILPSAKVDYENIEGDPMVDESSPIELLVVYGQLSVQADATAPRLIDEGRIVISATVLDADGVTPVQDASVYALVEREVAGNWQTAYTVPMGWSVGNQEYIGLTPMIQTGGNYRVRVTAQKDLYDDGSFVTTEFEIMAPNPDITGEGNVNFLDFSVLANYWQFVDCNGLNDWCEKADIDKSGVVDLNDLLMMTEHWLEGTITEAYDYDLNDFATEVVSYVQGTGIPYDFLSDLYFDNPNNALGRPTVDTTGDDYCIPLNTIVPVVNVYPAFRPFELVTIGEGGKLVLKFNHPVKDDDNNPYGIDFIVFGNAFQESSTFWINGDPNLFIITTSVVCQELATVSVSQDGINWYTYNNGPYADTFPPTFGRVYDPNNPDTSIGSWNHWWAQPTNPTIPIDPTITPAMTSGKTVAQISKMYGLSAGGIGFDLAESGMDWILYVKIEGNNEFTPEIDAVSDVSCE